MSLVHTTLEHIQRDQIEIINLENQHATLQVSLFAGHILSYVPKHDQRERLWVSDKAKYDGSTPIRGGVPICWPWFGPASQHHLRGHSTLPAHGIVRTCDWQVVHLSESEYESCLSLKPIIAEKYKNIGELTVTLHIRFGKQLSISLETHNASDHDETFFAALHSYFAVNDIQHTLVEGITAEYVDKLDNSAVKPAPSPYEITEEIDRVHLGTCNEILISDGEHSTRIESSGHDSIVVWNPWQERSSAMADMVDDGYKTMICVETARTQPNVLPAGKVHRLTQIIS